MVHIFDGKRLASEKLDELTVRILRVKKTGIIPKLVAIRVGENKASGIFLREKKKAARKVEVEFVIRKFKKDIKLNELIELIRKLNKNASVHGVMIQLPLPASFSSEGRDDLINAIASEKDIDGMREDSPFTAPVVQAVNYVSSEALNIVRPPLKVAPLKVGVVGARGVVGRKLVRFFNRRNNPLIQETIPGKGNESVIELDLEVGDRSLKQRMQDADVLICASGVPGLIKGNMVKKGVVLIDVGSPEGDVDKSTYEKASFVSPVPGGIGPLTVYYLLENLVSEVLLNSWRYIFLRCVPEQ